MPSYKTVRFAIGTVVLSAGLSAVATASDFSSIVDVTAPYAARDVLTSQPVSGGYTVAGGKLYTWSNASNLGLNAGYQIGDINSGAFTTIGFPPDFDASDGYGDAFGAYDPINNVFYAGTYNSDVVTVFRYENATDAWSAPTTGLGTYLNLYGADVHAGELYISGLNDTFASGSDNKIALFDLTGGNQHDTLLSLSGYSAHVALDRSGNLYYAAYDNEPKLFRWTADQLDSVRADKGNGTAGGGAEDLYLTYDDGELLSLLPGGSNGIAVDDGGNVFISVNGTASELLLWNDALGIGSANNTEVIASLDALLPYGWFGPLDTVGDFFDGGAIYLSNYASNGLAEITLVPEPSSIAMIGLAMAALRRRRRKLAAACGATMLAVPAMALAGPYSTAAENVNPGAVDAGIPGYVGPQGDGVIHANNTINPLFAGWATQVISYSPAPGVAANWQTPANALGPVTGDNGGIVTLGDLYSTTAVPNGVNVNDPNDNYGFIGIDAPGSITLGFDLAIRNGPGADFAAFENGFISQGGAGIAGEIFAEFAYLEVSTNGTDYARFPSISLTPNAVGGYGTVNPTNVYNLVGKHINNYNQSWGTPFDLDDLLGHALVLGGQVDLNDINYVRIVDVPGNGAFLDSEGRPIYDAWVTFGSGGTDFDALGVIHQVPEPSLAVLAAPALMLLRRRRSA